MNVFLKSLVNERRVEILQKLILQIFFAQYDFIRRYSPINTKRLVEYAYAGLGLRRIEVVALVLKDGRFRKHGETVSKTFRHEKLQMIIFV